MSENHAWVWVDGYYAREVAFLCYACAEAYERCVTFQPQMKPLPACEDCGDDYKTAMRREIGEAP